MIRLQPFLIPCLLAALAAIAITSRWRIISEHASPVPFHDQWTAEGTAIFEPWSAGKLTAGDFWKSSNEHRPALTRALAFSEFLLTGEWNTRLQMLVNSLFHGLTAVVLAVIARQLFGARGLVVSAVILAVLFSLPCTYENAMWGFQSQFYLMMLLGAAYLGGTFCSARIGRLWILAQLSGALGILAMGGAMMAPAAAGGIAAVRLLRKRDAHSIATLLLAVALALAGWATIVPANDPSGTLQSRSAAILVEALVKLLAWPSAHWFLAPLLVAPWLLVSARVLLAREPSRGEVVLAALGGWVLLQSIAIAYGRGSHLDGIPPRYFDAFLVGTAVNAACLPLLLRMRGPKVDVAILAVAWVAVTGAGLWQNNKPAWINPIIRGNGGLQHGTFESVRDYVTSGDPAALTRDPFIAHHYPSIATMRRLLDDPGIRASLPATLRGEATPSTVERFTNGTLGSWPWLMGLAITVLATSAFAIATGKNAETLEKAPSTAGVPWLGSAVILAAAAFALVLAGMHPWETDAGRRLTRIFKSSGESVPGFEIPGAAGAIYTGGGAPAALFYGTFIKADSFEGEKVSTGFRVARRYLLLPIVGYPGSSGNSLRVDVLADNGSVIRKVNYSGPQPGEAIGEWTLDLEKSRGSNARLVLIDGSSQPRGWLGVGTPIFTDDPAAARRFDIAIQSSGKDRARRLPAVLLATSALFAVTEIARRRKPAVRS